MCGALYLFYSFQVDNFMGATNLLPSLTDTVRTMSIVYAYPSLIYVACWYRQLYAAYFNCLYDLDDLIAVRFSVRPDCRHIRRKFWWHSGLWLFNHMLVVLPLELHYHFGAPFEVTAFELADATTAIGTGMTTMFLEFAVRNCRERYVCLGECLQQALTADGGRSKIADVRDSIRLMSEADTAKERLNDDFGALLVLKLSIDSVNMIASMHFGIYNLLNHQRLTEKMHSAMSYALFDFPYVVANVAMVNQYQALGNVVSE